MLRYTICVDTRDPVSGLLKWIGWLTWLAVGLPEAIAFAQTPALLSSTNSLIWVIAFLSFGPALIVSNKTKDKPNAFPIQILALGIATISPLVMIYLKPECFAGALTVIVAWNAPLQLPTRLATAWVAGQILLLSAVLMLLAPNSLGVAESVIFGGFQIYAFLTAYVAQRETKARYELLRTNAELKTTQLLLAQSVRVGERVRISRELHDVLGHDLTALSLHLEIARNAPETVRQDIDSAQTIAKELLKKLRDVVSLVRGDDRASLASLLQTLAVDGPQLKVHLNMQGNLEAADASRAHTLVRCLQEIITNARRHSGASNLWLDIRRQGNSVVAHARDDGHGADNFQFGHGLTGMSERLEEFGGSLAVQNRREHGFALEVTLPLGAV